MQCNELFTKVFSIYVFKSPVTSIVFICDVILNFSEKKPVEYFAFIFSLYIVFKR